MILLITRKIRVYVLSYVVIILGCESIFIILHVNVNVSYYYYYLYAYIIVIVISTNKTLIMILPITTIL